MLIFTQKIRTVSKVLIASIPSAIIEAGELKEGDIVEIRIKKINKKSKDKTKSDISQVKLGIPRAEILTALRSLYDDALQDARLKDLDATQGYLRDNNTILGINPGIPRITDFKINAGAIRNKMIAQGTDLTEYKNIYNDILDYLSEVGFTITERKSNINYRIINTDKLEDLTGKIPDLPPLTKHYKEDDEERVIGFALTTPKSIKG